ncbi:MAG: site-specific DNA-methyltransferase [Candidatus Contendobacter sp.]|nr:MAG: site-specific DNA-methyltransferase [Candidatus Contendobacter sp.]
MTHLTGKSNSFPNPKPTTLIERFILQTTDADEWMMNFFAGSGATFHAAISARHDDRQRRRVFRQWRCSSATATTRLPARGCKTSWPGILPTGC